MRPDIPWNLFTKKLRKEISEEEELELEFWRSKAELNRLIYEEVFSNERFMSLIINGKWDDNSRQWQNLLSRINQPATRKYSFSRRQLVYLSSAAAAVLVLLAVSLAFYYSGFSRLMKEQVAEGSTYIFSPRGQRTSIILPDSTKVWLNSESSLSYSTDYNHKVREVTTRGEAFFEVSKNPDKPFYVLANEVRVKVYGTSFNVKAFPDENRIETTLIEGKLSVTPIKSQGEPGREIFLKPNEKCIYVRGTKEMRLESGKEKSSIRELREATTIPKFIIRKNISTAVEAQWKDGKLLFEDESFAELAVKLERWYDVKIHFVDSGIRNYKFTGSFNKETVNQAMEALKLSSQKSYEYEIVFRDIYLKTK
jgi:transmembrane sensor